MSNSASDLAPWRSPLSRALHRNRAQPFCRFLQLATLRLDGTPANRTVVFRGFFDSLSFGSLSHPLDAETTPENPSAQDGNQLMIISDRRSEKISQIQQNPHAEACWYFTKTREQFRLSGRLQIVTAETEDSVLKQARDQIWQNISDNARTQFAWPQPKASRIEDSAAFCPDEAPARQTALPDFCLLLLSVHSVDHLSLRGEPQNRTLYESTESNNQWSVKAVNP
ncbi:MAG: pyridoxamine 5'-phosphate oxidase family protein [Cyanobacteria bacterium J06632_3]